MRPESYYAAAALVGVLAQAWVVRIVTQEEFPPVIAFKVWYQNKVGNGPWTKVVDCLWCLSPYVGVIIAAWAFLSDLHWSWWFINGLAASSYVASLIVFHDEG